MLRKSRKLLSFITSICMAVTSLSGTMAESLQVKAAVSVSNPRIADDGTVTWDKVEFGSYYQNLKGVEESPIKWRILDIDDNGNALLLADQTLDCKYYNEKGVQKIDSEGKAYTDYSCTWATSTLRAWLNGTGDYVNDGSSFFNAAFNDEERESIKNTNINNNGNSTNSDGDITDKVFLMSVEDATNSEYGFDTTLGESSTTREAKPTDYAKINGARCSNNVDCIGNSDYWLRASNYNYIPEYNSVDGVSLVSFDGWGFSSGVWLNHGAFPVRPVLRVDLSSSDVRDAGKVTSSGSSMEGSNRNAKDYLRPIRDDDGVTTWDCVFFGSYKQKALFEKKPIEWRVLSVNGNDAFLLSEKAIDCKTIYKTYYSCTWETSPFRAWLNGTGD